MNFVAGTSCHRGAPPSRNSEVDSRLGYTLTVRDGAGATTPCTPTDIEPPRKTTSGNAAITIAVATRRDTSAVGTGNLPIFNNFLRSRIGHATRTAPNPGELPTRCILDEPRPLGGSPWAHTMPAPQGFWSDDPVGAESPSRTAHTGGCRPCGRPRERGGRRGVVRRTYV